MAIGWRAVDARIEQVVTSGKRTLDDTEHEVENNTWIVGDDDESIVIDPAHDAEAILKVVGDREILAVICTNGHDDHLNVALEIAEHDPDDPAPIALHPRDRKLWRAYFARLGEKDIPEPDFYIEDGGVFEVGEVQIDVMHTPGHTPGSICLYIDRLGVLFTGDTLYKGKPGEVGGSYPDITGQLNSIGGLFGPLPGDTRVLPGRGEETTIAEEDDRWESWFALADGSAEVPATTVATVTERTVTIDPAEATTDADGADSDDADEDAAEAADAEAADAADADADADAADADESDGADESDEDADAATSGSAADGAGKAKR
jgi:glyoxylase-like metal-dependent hydrolase (beta-lactamase superfamily II)